MDNLALFEEQVERWGLVVSPEKRERLLAYVRLLSRYDRANVIGTKVPEQILGRHVLDSLSCLLVPMFVSAGEIADVGSGGGLPGIPLAIMLDGARVTLFEATGKKAAFLRYAREELALGNLGVVNGRIEELGRQREHRGNYEVCTARAVARLSVLAEYCLPLLREGGQVVAMKGREDREELREGERAAKVLGGEVREVLRVSAVAALEQRETRLVVLQKISRTPDAYPRRTGVPAKEPLGK